MAYLHPGFTLTEIAEEFGLNAKVLRARARRGDFKHLTNQTSPTKKWPRLPWKYAMKDKKKMVRLLKKGKISVDTAAPVV